MLLNCQKLLLLFWLNILFAGSVQANDLCFNQAGQRYRIDPVLLRAIAIQESHLNAQALGVNRDKSGKILSYDYGIMQINERNIGKLQQQGIIQQREDLNNPCINIHAGAWILARHFRSCGVNWNCLGSYNAGFKDKNQDQRMRYARKIYDNWQQLHNNKIATVSSVVTIVPVNR